MVWDMKIFVTRQDSISFDILEQFWPKNQWFKKDTKWQMTRGGVFQKMSRDIFLAKMNIFTVFEHISSQF